MLMPQTDYPEIALDLERALVAFAVTDRAPDPRDKVPDLIHPRLDLLPRRIDHNFGPGRIRFNLRWRLIRIVLRALWPPLGEPFRNRPRDPDAGLPGQGTSA